MLLHVGHRVGVLGKDGLEYLRGSAPVQLAVRDHLDNRRQRLRSEEHLLDLQSLLLQQAQQIRHDPVGGLLGVGAQCNRLFKEVCQLPGLGQQPRIVGGKAKRTDIPGLLRLRHLREACLHFRQIGFAQLHRGDVRLREVAVILGVFLRAHGKTGVLVLIPAAGLLNHPLVVQLDQLLLTAGLVADGPGNGFKGVQVLHLRPGAELTGTLRPDRQVDIAAERALLHLAVRHPQIGQGGAELFQISDDLVRCAEVRLGDDFHQRHAAAVIVRPRLVDPVVVDQLAGVLLHMQLVNADHLLLAAYLDGNLAVPADGEIELGDLVCLGKVGVEVVLPVELAVPGDLTV